MEQLFKNKEKKHCFPNVVVKVEKRIVQVSLIDPEIAFKDNRKCYAFEDQLVENLKGIIPSRQECCGGRIRYYMTAIFYFTHQFYRMVKMNTTPDLGSGPSC